MKLVKENVFTFIQVWLHFDVETDQATCLSPLRWWDDHLYSPRHYMHLQGTDIVQLWNAGGHHGDTLMCTLFIEEGTLLTRLNRISPSMPIV